MINSLNIDYYNSMIDIVEENRKINEMIMAPKYMKLAESSQEDISIYEGKVTNFIIESIKKIIDKVIEFFGKMVKLVSRKDMFTPNKKLMDASYQKLKTMSKEDISNFKLEDIDLSDSIEETIDEIHEEFMEANNHLNTVINRIKDAYYNWNQEFEDSKYIKIHDDIEILKSKLEDKSDLSRLKKVSLPRY